VKEKKTVTIREESDDASLNICLDTVQKGKQILVFCNTKRGAESQAERTASKIKTENHELTLLSEEALSAVSTPTKQCKRLALCLKRGVAFHHAGLHPKQRALIEDNFRGGAIKVICSTPTLAMGMDLPAFRVIIRDLKRFGEGNSWGMTDIPVLEYEQMAGRAGRPGKETYGEAIVLADTKDQEEQLTEKYLHGDPEEILSKLAVEPVLRTYVLSLIASDFVSTRTGLHTFFAKTFYARQYGDTKKLNSILDSMIRKLQDWEFLEGIETEKKDIKSMFRSARELRDEKLHATPLGRRVAELYLDPMTAHFLIDCLRKGETRTLVREFAFLQMLSSCLELRPLLRPKVKEIEEITERTTQFLDGLLTSTPTMYSDEYDEFLMTLKTALFFYDWIDEVQEDTLLDRYGITPGEIHAKLERADWLLYASEELARLLALHKLRTPLARLRVRLKQGAREELLALLQLKNIGRVRARKLFANGLKNIQSVKEAEFSTLAGLVGKQIALDVKKQVGQEISPEKVQVKPNKRKGQTSMQDYQNEY